MEPQRIHPSSGFDLQQSALARPSIAGGRRCSVGSSQVRSPAEIAYGKDDLVNALAAVEGVKDEPGVRKKFTRAFQRACDILLRIIGYSTVAGKQTFRIETGQEAQRMDRVANVARPKNPANRSAGHDHVTG